MMKRTQMVIPWILSQTGIGLSCVRCEVTESNNYCLTLQFETLRTPNTTITMPRTKQPKRKRKREQ